MGVPFSFKLLSVMRSSSRGDVVFLLLPFLIVAFYYIFTISAYVHTEECDYFVCVCVHVYVHMHVCCGRQRWILDVFMLYTLFFETGSPI